MSHEKTAADAAQGLAEVLHTFELEASAPNTHFADSVLLDIPLIESGVETVDR